MSKQSNASRLLRLITERRWLDIVSHLDPEQWDYGVAIFLTYSPSDKLSDLLSAFGQRLLASGAK